MRMKLVDTTVHTALQRVDTTQHRSASATRIETMVWLSLLMYTGGHYAPCLNPLAHVWYIQDAAATYVQLRICKSSRAAVAEDTLGECFSLSLSSSVPPPPVTSIANPVQIFGFGETKPERVLIGCCRRISVTSAGQREPAHEQLSRGMIGAAGPSAAALAVSPILLPATPVKQPSPGHHDWLARTCPAPQLAWPD